MNQLLRNLVEEIIQEDDRIRQYIIHRKFLRDAFNPFDAPDDTFERLYRLPKVIMIDVVDLITENYPDDIPIYMQVLATVRILASGKLYSWSKLSVL